VAIPSLYAAADLHVTNVAKGQASQSDAPLRVAGFGGDAAGYQVTEEMVAARAAAAEVTGTATALGKAQADSAAADIGLARATENLGNTEIDAEVRIQQALRAISTSMAAQLRLEKAMNADAVALEKAAAMSVATPVKLSGVDPDQSSRVQQLQLDLAINRAKESTLLAVSQQEKAAIAAGEAARKGAVTEVELTQARIRTLAVQERLTAAMEKQAAESQWHRWWRGWLRRRHGRPSDAEVLRLLSGVPGGLQAHR